MKHVTSSSSALCGAVMLLLASPCRAPQEPATEGVAPQATGNGPSVQISSPVDGARIKGNVVDLDVDVSDFDIVKANGDTSGKSGHFHVYVDKQPPPAKTVIPKEDGIFHATDDPIKLTGLSVGEHRLTIVLGDGTHARVGEAQDTVDVIVEGPSIDASAPAEIASGQDLQIETKADGVEIVKADQDEGGPETTGHFHILVDPASPPGADGGQIPKDAEEDRPFQIMYGVGGEMDLSERELPHLAGWRNSKPVRVGNAAWRQTQLDIYGEVLNALCVYVDRLGEPEEFVRHFIVDLADSAGRLWMQKMRACGRSAHSSVIMFRATASGEQLGNFPQAFSHVGLINAAHHIDEARDRP